MPTLLIAHGDSTNAPSPQISRDFCHGECASGGLYVPEAENARFCPDCRRWFHTTCLGDPVGTVEALRSGDTGLSVPDWITWDGPVGNRAQVDEITLDEVVNTLTLPVQRGNQECSVPGAPAWVISFERFILPLREELLAGRYDFAFTEHSWDSYVQERVSRCVLPPGDKEALLAAVSYLNVAGNIPLSDRDVYLCPFDDTHYI